jgi:predicted ATP-grasp superfamily ATP-dependent carboligase
MKNSWSVASNRPGKPLKVDVLVLDAQFRQSLAALRALGRGNVRVGAVACRSDADWAPAFKSRHCELSAIVPDFEGDPIGYADAVLSLLDAFPARLILPSHDGSIQSLRARRAEIERRTFLPLAPESALDIAVSKTRTLALAAELGIAVPQSIAVHSENDTRAALNALGCPAVIKPVQSWGESAGLGTRLGADSIRNVDEALRAVNKILAAGLTAVIQPWLPGRRDAVSLFYTAGTIWARFAQTSYREFPALGGSSVLCESIRPTADIVAPAEQLVRAAGLEGCAMVEFRRDREGRPVLMEINARMPGSVALAVAAGVNFPKLLHAWAVGKPLREIAEYRVGVRQRWLSGEVWFLKDVFADSGRPDTPGRASAVSTFFLDFFRRPSALTGVDFTDMRPALAELRHGVVEPLLGRVAKSTAASRAAIPERSDEPKQC